MKVQNTYQVDNSLENKWIFSEETLKSISRLGDVLQRIDRRMKNEGFCIKDGKIVRDENI